MFITFEFFDRYRISKSFDLEGHAGRKNRTRALKTRTKEGRREYFVSLMITGSTRWMNNRGN